jgi:hypothetical protein
MYAQLDLEVMCKRPKNKGTPSNFHGLWSEEVHHKENLPKKTLMFERYNLMDLME